MICVINGCYSVLSITLDDMRDGVVDDTTCVVKLCDGM